MTTSYVSAAKPKIGGAVYRAPLGTTLPTDSSSSLGTAFKELGYVSADGITNANSPSSSNIVAWGGDTVMTVSGEKPDTFAFTLLEVTNEEVLKAVYDDSNVTGALSTGLTVKANNNERPNCIYVIDMVLRGNTAKRIVIPSAAVSEVGEIVYKHDDATGYAITLNCEPDSNGNTHYEYIKAASTST